MSFPSGLVVKNSSSVQEMQAQSLGQEDPLEKGMATHSSILIWRIQRTEELGGLQSMGLQRVGMTEQLNNNMRWQTLTKLTVVIISRCM